MGRWRQGVIRHPIKEAGSVLVIVLLIITVLSLLGVTFLTLSMTESSISFNENRLGQAFYLADAGVAEAQRILRGSTNWNTQLTATHPFPCPTSVVSALDNPSAGDGCTFRIENDTADLGGATNDTNNLVIVKSTGQYQNAAKEVDVAVTRLTLPIPPGGVTSVGIATNVSFAGNAFEIDGNNWIPPSDDGGTPASQDNGACTTTCPKFGISVPDAVQQLAVKNNLNSSQQNNVTGATPNPPWAPPSATPSIGVDTTTLTQAQLTDLVNNLIPLADTRYTPGTSLSSATLGTQASPKITVVDATGYTGSDPALTFSASKGAGILIVKNGSLRFTGNSTWVGAVIVIGSNVSIDMRGGGDKSIYGSVLLAENLDVQAPNAEGEGNVKLRFSNQGVNVANDAGGGKLKGATVWWKEVY